MILKTVTNLATARFQPTFSGPGGTARRYPDPRAIASRPNWLPLELSACTREDAKRFQPGVGKGIKPLRLATFLCCVLLFSCHGQGQPLSPDEANSSAAEENSARDLLRQANRQLNDEEYRQAAALAEQAVEASPDSARVRQAAAELLFLAGNPGDSLAHFDRAIELAPEVAAHNWQRGIALCCCERFDEGAEQFKSHHDVNPDDVENSAWYFLCIAKTQDVEQARETVIPSRGDSRQPMMSVLEMLQGELRPAKVLEAAEAKTTAGPTRDRAKFFADLYVGLYYDSLGDSQKAIEYLRRSQSHGTSGYMTRAAAVYLQSRFPQATEDELDAR